MILCMVGVVVDHYNLTYRYIIDKKGMLHVYSREDTTNIHEFGENYGNTSATQFDLAVEKLGLGQRDNGGDSGTLQDGRESTDYDRNDLRSLSGTGEGERNRRSIHRPLAHRQKKSNDDGSSKGITTDERHSKKKVYKKSDASAVLREAVEEHLVFSDAYAKLKGKSKDEATKMLWDAFNTADGEAAQKAAALRVADFVIDNAIVETFEQDPNMEYYSDRLAVLKGYLRKLNLDGIKAEIRNRFGKDTSPYLVWGKREGDVGVAPDAIKNELIEQGIIIESSNPADIFFEIYNAYTEAKMNTLHKINSKPLRSFS